MRTSSMTLRALALLTTLTTGFVACDDTSKDASKKTSSSSSIVKAPEAPIAPPSPVAAPETKKEDTVAKIPEKNADDVGKKKVTVTDDDSDDVDSASLAELMTSTREALAAADTDRALKLAAKAVQKGPKRSSAWNLLGRAQLQAGKRKLAITSFEKAIELNATNSYAQNNLGLTLIYEGRYDDAIEALEAATEHAPVEAYMWNNLGMAYEHVDRLDDAREAYDKGAEMDSDNARESLARLAGVKSVIRTAKVDSTPKKPVKDGDQKDGPSTSMPQ